MRSKYAEKSRAQDRRRCGYSEAAASLPITVLFTTVPGTLEALRKAAVLAHELGADIRILVVQAVPYPLPLDEASANAELRFRRLRTLIEHDRIATRIEIRLCRDARQCIQDCLELHSLVVIGGRKSSWPLAREKVLARSLKRAGHQVIQAGN